MMTSESGRATRLGVALFALALASGCRSSTSTSESIGKGEPSPGAARVTLSATPSTLDSVTVDSGAVDSGAVDSGAEAGASCGDAGPPTTGLDGGASCGAALAASTFQYAICSCGSLQSTGVLTTDGYDSTKGGPTGALGANVGFNSSAAWSSAPSLGGNLFSPGGISAPKGGLVRGDLHLGGSIQGGGQSFTVDGNAFVEATLPSSVKVLGTVTHVSSTASPCNCGSPLPTTSLVSAHQAPNNEDSAIGLSASAAGGGNPSQIDLPCGAFYLTVISPSKPLTIAAHGHTELYIGGAVSASSALTFSIDPGGSLDLFVAGGFSATSTLTLGTATSPSSCRVYVAGSQFQVPSSASIACNIYAPSASIGLPSTTAYGSIFAAGVTASGSATLHYDTSIQSGSCASAPTCTVASCNDGNPCTVDSCNSNGTCSNTPAANGTSCPAGANACDRTYSCQAGACVGSNPVTCTAQDQCHGVGTCNASTGTCSNPALANGTACNDGNACTLGDSCSTGVCTGSSPVVCTAEDQCHSVGLCAPATGLCSNPALANGTACNDGNACTLGDSCQSGTCVGSSPVTCIALDACHVAGTCSPTTGQCSNPTASDGTACTGSNLCNQTYACAAGTCTGSNPVTCTAQDGCHVAGQCQPSTGSCTNPTVPDGTPCTGTNLCNQSYACAGGTCAGSNPVVCTASGQCQVAGACNPSTGSCSSSTAPDGTSCSDGNPCTTNDACTGGACAGTAVTCTASDSCHTAGTCDPISGACSSIAAADGTACTGTDPCQAYACLGGSCDGTPVQCQALDLCHTAGTCSAATGECSTPVIPGCVYAPTIGDNPFEPRASIIGRVQSTAGNAVTGYTVSVFDVPVGNAARSDVSVSVASDGSFRARLTTFPDSEPLRSPPHHEMLVIDTPGMLEVKREVYVHPGDAADVGLIFVVPQDPKVTMIDASGGVATDSQGLMELDIPAGALAQPTPIVITPIQEREAMPAPLPDVTITGYGFEIDPKSTKLAVPATVRVHNYRNFPTTMTIPAGSYDEVNGGWQHVGMATWDGSAFSYQITHFTPDDVNGNRKGELVVFNDPGRDPNHSDRICGGSSINIGGGSVRQSIAVPTYRHRGRDYGVSLNYDSGLAGNRTLGAAPTPSASAQAVPSTGVGVAVRGSLTGATCVPSDLAANLIASSPGSCNGGSCTLGGVVLSNVLSLQGSPYTIATQPSVGPATTPDSTWVTIPLNSDGTVPSTGFSPQHVSVTDSTSTTACAGGGGFGSPTPTPLTQITAQGGPLLTMDQRVLVHHRYSSPFGPGWAIENIDRFYREPNADHAVLVRGTGEEEDFRPYAVFTVAGGLATPDTSIGLARDSTTGQNFVAVDGGQILQINADGTTTAIVSGLAFDGSPQGMAISYVAGQRVFLVALTTRLLMVAANGPALSIYTRTGNSTEDYLPSQVAAQGNLAFYTEGDAPNPVLYRLRLTDSPPTAQVVSMPTDEAMGLDPSVALQAFRFLQPAGMAFAPSGELYVADALRNAVYSVSLDANGEPGPTSNIVRVVGDGVGGFAPFKGQPFPGRMFPINQPFYLSTADDGTLMMMTTYGVAVYDPIATEAQWLAFDQNVPGSDLGFSFALTPSGSIYGNLAATGPRSFLFKQSGRVALVTSVMASEYDPTRVVSYNGLAASLVDTTVGIVDSYDAQGRLIQRDLRTGEPLFSANYADAASDRVSSILDPEGNPTTFVYDGNGRLQTITEPGGPSARVTTLIHDSSGDLRSITFPDQEVMTFVYDAHHMVSKTTRSLDTTTYAYNPDGTLLSATKPAGEVTTLTQTALAQQATTDGNGNPIWPSSYVDAYGVTHSLVTDAVGQIVSDIYTADGVSYSATTSYYGNLETNDFFQTRHNILLRISDRTLNGVPTGLSTSFDSLGRVISTNDSPGLHSGLAILSLSYDGNGFISSYSVGPTNSGETITRDAAGHMLQIAQNDINFHRESDFTWRPDGQPATIVEHGVTYTLSYDDSSPQGTYNLTGVVDSLGRTSSLAYDGAGNIATAFDGATTNSFQYDGNNRLVVSADALNNQTQIAYTQVSCGCTEADEIATIHTPDLPAGKQWTLGYGAEGRLASATDPDGFIESYGYEPTGELKSLIDRNGNPTTITHDHLGRVATIVDALNREHLKAYPVPSFGNPPFGIPSAWIGPTLMSGSASTTPASTDFSAALGPGDYQIGEAFYPTRGYPATELFYRDATIDMSYQLSWDLGPRLTQMRDRTGVVSSSNGVDPNNGSMDFPSQFYNVGYNYDTESAGPFVGSLYFPGTNWEASFGLDDEFDSTDADGIGPICGDTFARTDYSYTLDTAGRRTAIQTTPIPGCSGAPFSKAQTYGYLAGSNRLQTYTGPEGNKNYVYDARGLVQSLSVTLPGGNSEQWSFTYDSSGRSFDVTYPDGHVREQLYDSEGRINSRCYTYGSQSFCYTASYDGAGNPLTMSDPYGGSEIYAYDVLNRLTTVTRSVGGSSEHVESYSYNAIGGLHTTFDPVAMAAVTLDDQRPKLSGSGTADAAIPNTFGGQPVTFNGGGQVTSLSGTTFNYDTTALLRGAQSTVGGNTITDSIRYDAYSRRNLHLHTETSPTVSTTEFDLLEGPNFEATLDGAGEVQSAYVFDGIDHPLRMAQVSYACSKDAATACVLSNGSYTCPEANPPSQTCVPSATHAYFYEVDLAGNVRRLRDSSGGMDLGGYRYTAFGNAFAADATTPAPSIDQPLRWKGRPFLNLAGGLYDMRARWWSPGMGAFLTIDGYQYHDASSTLWGWPGQNPIRSIDPSGHTGLTNAEFLYEFFTGNGPTDRTYTVGDLQGAEEAASPGADALRAAFYAGGETGVSDFSYGTWQAAKDTLFDPSQWGSTAFEVGGFAGATAVNNGDGTVTFTIPNVAGANSFFYHLLPNRESKTGWFRSINQKFTWTEPIPQCPK